MMKSISRRNFLKLSAAGAVAGISTTESEAYELSTSTNESRYPISARAWNENSKSLDIPYDGLVTSLRSENRYDCEVRGDLPSDLKGTLFRTGPGLFERGEHRRRMIIDADGMMRKFEFKNGTVTFANKHIRTEKFVAEERAGKYLYPSFGMMVPGGLLTNSLANIKNQASVTTFSFGGRLFATDELQPVTELNASTLETLRSSPFGDEKYKAHTRVTEFGAKILHLARFNVITSALQFDRFDEHFRRVGTSEAVRVTRSFHDWHVTENYYVILLPPAHMSPWMVMKAMAGKAVVGDAIQLKPNERAQILVISRQGRGHKFYNLPETLDSWHSVNAFEDTAGDIIFDFVATRVLSNPVSSRSPMFKIMTGELKEARGSARPTFVCRAKLGFVRGGASYSADHFGLHGVEMPTINPHLTGKNHGSAYFVSGIEGLDSQVVRLDHSTRTIDRYDFGPGKYVTEPVFASGYLLTEVYSHADRKSMLAVFKASELARGPVCEVWLRHHLPLGFHGCWVG